MSLLNAVRQYTLPKSAKQHILKRQPFLDISDAAIQKAIDLFQQFPRKRGIISDAIREITGEETTHPHEFVRFEAHFNIDDITQEIEDVIISLGFEPDDFVDLHPPEYTRNFTFAYDADNPVEERFRSDFLKQTCHRLMNSLKTKHNGVYFVEAERFASTNIRKFDCSNIKGASLMLAPYRTVPVPDKFGMENEFGFTPHTKKAIDVHIKLSGIVNATVNLKNKNTIETKEELAGALANLGLYRITSVSGNTIYTAQFHNGEKARYFIDTMTQFLEFTGLAESIISEPCFLFLRSEKNGTYAPVCHLLE